MPLILYTRQGCHLCEDFEQALHQLQQELGFQLIVRDVDADPDWVLRYNDKVPLLLAQDQDQNQDAEICRYFLDPQALRSYLSLGAV